MRAWTLSTVEAANRLRTERRLRDQRAEEEAAEKERQDQQATHEASAGSQSRARVVVPRAGTVLSMGAPHSVGRTSGGRGGPPPAGGSTSGVRAITTGRAQVVLRPAQLPSAVATHSNPPHQGTLPVETHLSIKK